MLNLKLNHAQVPGNLKSLSRWSPAAFPFLILGGHGRAVAGVYMEETCVGAAEAQRSTTEAGFRGDHTTVWVLSVVCCIPSQSMITFNILFLLSCVRNRRTNANYTYLI